MLSSFLFVLQFAVGYNPPSRDILIIVNHLIQGRNNAAGIGSERQPCDHYRREGDAPTNCAMLPIFNVFAFFNNVYF